MLECLLIKVYIIDPFDNNNIKFCEYYQVLKEEFYSVGSNLIEYKYYNLSRPLKKRLSRHTANTILLSYTSILDYYIAKNDNEYLNRYFCFKYAYATIVYKYTI